MALGLRCRLGLHKWVLLHDAEITYRACARCGKGAGDVMGPGHPGGVAAGPQPPRA